MPEKTPKFVSRRNVLKSIGATAGLLVAHPLLQACGSPSVSVSPTAPAPAVEATSAVAPTEVATAADAVPTEAPVSTAPAASAAKTPVELWTGFGQGRMGEALTGIVTNFNEQYPQFEAKHVVVPWGELHNKVIAGVAAGNPPDVFRGWSFLIGDDASVGALSPLDEYASTEPNMNLEDFWEPTLNQMKYQGKLYGLSVSTMVDLLYYNKDRMEEKGLDPESVPDTLEGWEEIGEQLTEVVDGKLTKVGFVPFIPSYNPYGWVAAMGGSIYDESTQTVTANNPAMIKTMEWFKQYGDKYGAENINAFVSSYSGNSFGRNTPEGVYYTGLLSVWRQPTWLYNDMKEYGPDVNFGVAKVPSPAGVQGRPGELQSNMYLVPKGPKNTAGGFAFANFMCTNRDAALAEAIPDSVTPSRKSLAQDPEVERASPWIKLARDEILPYALPQPNMPAINFYMTAMGEAAQEVLFKGGDPKQVLDDLTEQVQREVDKKLKA
jgi:multiple sugar transport system substrate-binding protein